MFDSGEEFVFTVTTQNSIADEMDPANDDHTNSAVGYWSSDIADDGDQYRPTVGAEVNETVIIPINVTTSYYFGIQGSQMPGGVSQGEASMTLICRASSNTPSSDATLSALTLSSGTLSPSFASGTITYTASVGNGASSLTLTPTTNSGGTVTINGNAAASGQGFPVSLSVGDNMLSVVVTAADGTTTKTYTLAVTRAAAAPVVISLSPSTGSTSGGTAITIAGTDFTGATNVTIGGQAATNVSVVSATQITATTPAHIAGAVDVVVTTPGGSGTLTNGFTYSTSTPTVVVTASNANPSLGDTVTLTATLSNGSSPSGTVTFKDNGATLGTGTISGTTASYSTSGLGTGSHSITAEYAGDTNNAATTSSSITVSVGQSTPTVVVTSSNANPSLGDTVTLTATLSNGSSPSGTVTFKDNGATLGTGTISGTTASYSTSGLSTGSHSITAEYAGDTNNAAATSSSITVSVGQSTPTVVVTASNANPSLGDTVTLTATLSNGSSPSGTVTFKDNGATLGTGTISGATASYSTSGLSTGSHSITAEYAGDTNNAAATSSSITVSVGQSTPTVVVTASNANPSPGDTVTFTATLSNGSSPSGTVTFKDNGATLGTGTISGTTASYSTSGLSTGSHSITAEYAGDTNNAAATSSSITVSVGQSTPTVVVTASNANPSLGDTVTFTATLSNGSSPSGTVTFKDNGATLGTGTISGTTASYSTSGLSTGSHSITAEYAGDTNNAAATSSSITVSVGQSTPTVVVTASNANPSPGDTVTFTATLSNGSSPSGTVTFKDNGVTLGTGTISGATASYSTSGLGTGSHSITAEYAGDTNNAVATSSSITVSVGQSTPTVVVTASNANPSPGDTVTFTATLSNGSSPSGTVTFKDNGATLGTGTISGTTASYSTSGLSTGSHSITAEYVGDTNNAAATSSTLTVTVAAPVFTFSPAGGALPSAVAGSVYDQAVTASASGGTLPLSYTLGAGTLPDGLTLNTATGAISGTPTTAANYAFTITATDSSSPPNSASASYTLVVNAPAAFVFSPAGGSLPEAMSGEYYQQPVSANGGTGAVTYSITSGSLPPGLTLNVTTGELNGPLDADTEGDYSFTIRALDSANVAGTASYTLHVAPRAVKVVDKTVSVAPGSAPNNINLAAGATGGPFVSAEITTITQNSAGTFSVVNGEFAQASGPTPTSWYLKFRPNPAFSGSVTVGFRLTSALGVSNTGSVTYNIGYDAASVAEDMDTLVHGFVETRQSLIASMIKIPGLLERRRMGQATDAVTARMSPSVMGVTLGFSTSLAQMEAARDNGDEIVADEQVPFNIWIDSTFMAHNRDDNGDKWGNFAMVSAGADYLLSSRALIGLSFHYDRMTDPTEEDATLTGNGWFAGPNASFEIGKNIFWNTSLLYGGSANSIDTQFWDGDFDTTRWMFDTSISGVWNLDDVTTLIPKLRTLYFSETVDDYSVRNSDGDVLTIDGFTEEQLRVSLGAELARQFTLENDRVLTPKLGLTGGVSDLDNNGAFGQLSAGLSLETEKNWNIDAGLLFNFSAGDEKSLGVKVGLGGKF
ncbi:Ig-like domain repeat protein [Agrobacterium sp. fls2-241-TYG-188a]|uniref:Ig-like domain repeat protein n=1 Tax=Agrobacterium sp. fls2-241-TYG-188a TaxID=3040275 RepID=UPI0025500856|nr:Ig-like domain repeat protein [Agrobacterium sp. fls2-241-TYG-188a]